MSKWPWRDRESWRRGVERSPILSPGASNNSFSTAPRESARPLSAVGSVRCSVL